MADDNIKDVGFAISTLDEDVIRENAYHYFIEENISKRELTDEDWEILNDDIGRLTL